MRHALAGFALVLVALIAWANPAGAGHLESESDPRQYADYSPDTLQAGEVLHIEGWCDPQWDEVTLYFARYVSKGEEPLGFHKRLPITPGETWSINLAIPRSYPAGDYGLQVACFEESHSDAHADGIGTGPVTLTAPPTTTTRHVATTTSVHTIPPASSTTVVPSSSTSLAEPSTTLEAKPSTTSTLSSLASGQPVAATAPGTERDGAQRAIWFMGAGTVAVIIALAVAVRIRRTRADIASEQH